MRKSLLAVHAVLALALVLAFNEASIHRRIAPAIPKLQVDWIGVPLSLLDNLRMPQHLAQAEVLARIEAEVPDGATLYFLDVDYYRDAQHGVYERAGLVRPAITTRYASSRDFRPEEPVFYVHSRREPGLELLGHVTRLETDLYLVER